MTWKQDFLEKLTPPNPCATDIAGALQIKNLKVPQYLYRFREVTKDSLLNLDTSTVWLTSPDRYNDPFDSVFHVNFRRLLSDSFRQNYDELSDALNMKARLSEDDIHALAECDDFMVELLKRLTRTDVNIPKGHDEAFIATMEGVVRKFAQAKNTELENRIRNETRLCSFSATHRSIIMWSHYAANHEGFCVRYDFGALKSDALLKYLIYPVIYSTKLFDATEYFREAAKNPKEFNNLFALLACIHKSHVWSYEREWRLVSTFGEFGPMRNIQSPPIKSVFLGAKMSEENEDEIRRLISGRDVEIYRASLSQDNFELKFSQANACF